MHREYSEDTLDLSQTQAGACYTTTFRGLLMGSLGQFQSWCCRIRCWVASSVCHSSPVLKEGPGVMQYS